MERLSKISRFERSSHSLRRMAACATLALAGIQPIRGREYYDISALPVIMDVVDNYPRQTSADR